MTGEKKRIIEMYQQGCNLGEIVDAVDRHPSVVINYLLRDSKISQPVSYEEARTLMPGMQKRFNQKGVRFADHRGAGFTLGQWASYYGHPIADVCKIVEEDIDCAIKVLLESDVQVLCAREKQKKDEFSDRETPPDFSNAIKKSWALLYTKTDLTQSPLFVGERSLCSIWLRLAGATDNVVFSTAVQRLFAGLTGVMTDPQTNVNNFMDHHEPSGLGGDKYSETMSVSIKAFLNISAVDSFIKAWANKYCFVLQEFEYLSEKITMQTRLNLQQIVDGSLEDGEI